MIKLLLLPLLISCSNLKIVGVRDKEPPIRVAWSKNLDAAYNSGNLPISLAKPAVYDDILYMSDADNMMSAYNLSDGRIIWRKRDKGVGHASGAVSDEIFLYGDNAGRVYARNYLSGKLIYNIDLKSAVESAPTIYKGRAVFHLRNSKIVVLDFKTGKILWAYQRSIPFTTTLQGVSHPVVYKGNLYCGFADGYIVSLNMEDGLVLWEKKLSSGTRFIDVDIRPWFHNDQLYVGSLGGPYHVLNPKTGNTLQQIPHIVTRVPLLTKNGKILATQNGEIVRLAEGNRVDKTLRLGNYPITALTKWKDYLVVGDANGKVFWLNFENWELVKKLDLGSVSSSIYASFISVDKSLVVFSTRNRLYVFN